MVRREEKEEVNRFRHHQAVFRMRDTTICELSFLKLERIYGSAVSIACCPMGRGFGPREGELLLGAPAPIERLSRIHLTSLGYILARKDVSCQLRLLPILP